MRSFFLLTILSLSPTSWGQSGTVAEQFLLSAINQERLARQLAPVKFDAMLQRAAALHAREMASRRTISHRFAGEAELSARGSSAGARFDLITENVAESSTALRIHDAWMNSPGHRANILDPAVDAVGIAVIERDGQLYAVEDFARNVRNLTLEQQESVVGILLDQAGVKIVADSDARRTCTMTSGYAGDQQPAFVMRYTTADLSKLPDKLKDRLAGKLNRRASVGACPVGGDSSFTQYRIVVILYH